MKSILHQLYEGEICPEADAIESPETRETNKKIGLEKEYFRNKLPAEDHERFEAFCDLHLHLSSLYSADDFASGYKLATKIMAEVYTRGEEPVNDEDEDMGDKD